MTGRAMKPGISTGKRVAPQRHENFLQTNADSINGNSRILKWRYLPYIRPIVQAYVSEYPQKIWPNGTNVPPFRILKISH